MPSTQATCLHIKWCTNKYLLL